MSVEKAERFRQTVAARYANGTRAQTCVKFTNSAGSLFGQGDYKTNTYRRLASCPKIEVHYTAPETATHIYSQHANHFVCTSIPISSLCPRPELYCFAFFHFLFLFMYEHRVCLLFVTCCDSGSAESGREHTCGN